MDLQLPPTPPMDLSDSNSNSSNDFKVSFIQQKVVKVISKIHKKMRNFKLKKTCALNHVSAWCNHAFADLIAEACESEGTEKKLVPIFVHKVLQTFEWKYLNNL